MNNLNFLDPNPSGLKAVLLLHGLGANGSSWTLQFDPLIKSGFRPLAPDAPGFGDSPYDGKGWNIPRAAAIMAEFLLEMNIAPSHVVGISMGGTIAQQLTLDFPQMVRKLVLVNTFSVLRPKRLSGWLYFFQRFILVHSLGLPIQAKFVAGRIFPHEDQQVLRDLLIDQISKADPRAYRAAMRSLGLFNSSKRLSEINTPTLVVTSERDTTVPLESQRLLAERIMGAQQVVIPGAGHAVSVDHPEQFNKVLLDFLREQPSY
jgi:pimeloyl-ACP methyl ester carboxylesterase